MTFEQLRIARLEQNRRIGGVQRRHHRNPDRDDDKRGGCDRQDHPEMLFYGDPVVEKVDWPLILILQLPAKRGVHDFSFDRLRAPNEIWRWLGHFLLVLESWHWYRHFGQEIVNNVGPNLEVRIWNIDYVVRTNRNVRSGAGSNPLQVHRNRHLVAGRVTANQRRLTRSTRVHRPARRPHRAEHGQPRTNLEESGPVNPPGDHHVATAG